MVDFYSDKYIFEIAIYSCGPDNFFKNRDKKLQEHIDWLIKTSGGITPDQAPEIFRETERHFVKKHGGWRYTQAIGWIRIYIFGWDVRGEYWFVNAKRINLEMNKKKFGWKGKAFELSFSPGSISSLEIYQAISIRLEKLKSERPFKGRYIDMEAFHSVGPFINWRKILNLE